MQEMDASIETLNVMSQTEFVVALEGIFEHSPWVAERAWAHLPYYSLNDLFEHLLAVIDEASELEKLTLLRAHPQLAGKEAKAGTLTDASLKEQLAVQLNALTPEEYKKISYWNDAYFSKFSFPFIVAVKDHNKDSLFQCFEQRLHHSHQEELSEAIKQVGMIARYRFYERFGN